MNPASIITYGGKTMYLQPNGQYSSRKPRKGRNVTAQARKMRKSVEAKLSGHAAPSSKPRKQVKHEESELQIRCVDWFRWQYKRELIFSVPNGMHLAGSAKQRAIQMARFKREGLLPGASDLIVVHDGGTAYLECKDDTGTQSDEQRRFEAMVKAMGQPYFVFRSFEQFQEVVIKIIGR